MPLRAAVVGAGLMGRWHTQAVGRLGFQVVAVVDTDLRAAQSLAARAGNGARSFEDLSSCLLACPVDVVHVCVPVGAHVPLVRTAIEQGLHVLVEKPLAPSLEETRAILELARRAGVSVNPVHQFPFQDGVRSLVARRAELGEVVRVAYRTSSAGGVGLSARGRQEIVRDIVPHPVSLFHRFVPGFDPSQFKLLAQRDDLALAGHHGTTYLEAFITLRGRPPCNELQIVGTRASAVADLFHGYSIFDRRSAFGRGKLVRPFALGARLVTGASANGLRRVARFEPAYPGLRELIRQFYASVVTGTPPPIGEEEVLASASLVDAAGEILLEPSESTV